MLVCTFLCLSLNSQDLFKKGYIIDKSNKKTECLIKDLDWKNNPSEIEYKISGSENIFIGNYDNINEFKVYNSSKYVFFEGDIEKSSLSLNLIGKERNPNFVTEKIFLKVLVDGKAMLYSYTGSNLYKYFYQKENSGISQLIYKKFLIGNSQTDVGINNKYKQTLLNKLTCNTISEKDFLRLDYTAKSLTNLFIKYNTCVNPSFINTISKKRKGKFNFYVKGGLTYSNLIANNKPNSNLNSDYGYKLGYSLGSEFEYIFPFNNNKWSFLFEPTYNSYESDIILESSTFSGGTLDVKADYTSIDLTFGPRYYFSLKNKESKLFANIFIVFSKPISSSLKATNRNDNLYNLEVKGLTPNAALGFGYLLNDEYSFELRYRIDRNIMSDFLSWQANYGGLSLLFAYKIF
ncbi:hypothetical protein SAMN05216503_2578 [Polaribacter sp. KT25b]|uniref:porin family protein n=1 Tax=Polaribacter sp. KT25b TaxID=1855336 RepID=UPI00087CF431|nr:porin family protein [Polaribacter sp. KT25b]SDS28893.1 hypothetical protein SAMN05216503_2578 [Polaribacter sp. KT25b]